MMRRQGDRVQFDLTEDEFQSLLIVMGYAIGARSQHEPLPYSWLKLANAVNEGNPNWTPYEIPEGK